MKADYPLMAFKTPRSFETWLSRNHTKAEGIRLKVAKRASGIASIRYDDALDIALCYGWIDGRSKSIDETWYWQCFTPRRTRSLWSKRNRDLVARLIEEGRMQPAGQREIDRAKVDGRWDAAYDSPANAKVPADLEEALRNSPRGRRFFESLDAQNRYAILHRLMTARKPETRSKRLAAFVQMLVEGRKLYPKSST
jgi:uncharacterized protein YdeI (YjbR/CyaY-like superfamily)